MVAPPRWGNRIYFLVPGEGDKHTKCSPVQRSLNSLVPKVIAEENVEAGEVPASYAFIFWTEADARFG